jgi:alpha-tubulin suppressor-like RCC1 family protein
VSLVAGGWRHTLAADDSGSLWAWGWNLFGQLALGHNADMETPTEVIALAGKSVAKLTSGWRHTMVVTQSGEFFSWGRGVNGESDGKRSLHRRGII